MADQAEILRKRREARQKKILESGESRLSKITGTSGTNAQVVPSPAVIQAREQLQKKEQEEERLKAMKAAVGAGTVPAIISAGDTVESSEPGKKEVKEGGREKVHLYRKSIPEGINFARHMDVPQFF